MSQSRSRFTLRRRILEALIVLWVIAHFAGFFEDAPPPTPGSPTPVSTPHR